MAQGIKLIGTEHTFTEQSPDAFPLMVWSIDDERGSPPQHTHDFCEIVYIRKGSAMHLHGGNRYPIHAGDCCFMAPHDVEGFDERDNLCLTNVMFYARILDPVIADLRAIPGFSRFFGIEPIFRDENLFRHKLHLSAGNQREMVWLLTRIEKELRDEKPGFRVSATAQLHEIIVFICRCFAESIAGDPVEKAFTGQERAVAAAIAYLETNYQKSINMRDLARSVHLSPAWLSHQFRDATGTSLIDYLTRFRIDAACALLRESSLSVKEISYRVGFHDPAYFTRAFTRLMRKPPKDYRGGLARS